MDEMDEKKKKAFGIFFKLDAPRKKELSFKKGLSCLRNNKTLKFDL
jgi:hypothetical protein